MPPGKYPIPHFTQHATQRPTPRQALPDRHHLVSGFTLIELLIVLAIMATLLAIVAPRYMGSLDKAKEATLKTNLRGLREAIDKYHADRGQYPPTLQDLVTARYIHAVPVDPFTEKNDTWQTIPPPLGDSPYAGKPNIEETTKSLPSTPPSTSPNASPNASPGAGVYEVRSGASGLSDDGTPLDTW